jgi:hypothetical protein
LGLPTWSAQITRSGAVPNDEANDQAVVQIGGSHVLTAIGDRDAVLLQPDNASGLIFSAYSEG